ncbi:unnamed protein product, partial [Phaeothamnion confervicola]
MLHLALLPLLTGKTRSCAYMFTNCVADRENFFDMLSARIPVNAIGECRGSLAKDSPSWQPKRNKGQAHYLDLAVEAFQPYRFVIAFESFQVAGYITEKLINPMFANAIPVYRDGGTAREYFNPKSFVDCGTYATLEDCADAVAVLHANRTAYIEMLREPWIAPDRLEALFSSHPDVPNDALVRSVA